MVLTLRTILQTVLSVKPPCLPQWISEDSNESQGKMEENKDDSVLNSEGLHDCLYLCSLPGKGGEGKGTGDEVRRSIGAPELPATKRVGNCQESRAFVDYRPILAESLRCLARFALRCRGLCESGANFAFYPSVASALRGRGCAC